jgi:hypothetical protein
VAPLGQAVIGGLLMSTFTTLLVLPHLFVIVRRKASLQSVSLDPDDTSSRYAGETFISHNQKTKIEL